MINCDNVIHQLPMRYGKIIFLFVQRKRQGNRCIKNYTDSPYFLRAKKKQQNNLVVEMKKELCKSEEADGRRQRVERTIERPLTYPNVKLASSHGVIF